MILENNSPRQSPELSDYKHLMVKNERLPVLSTISAINNITIIVCEMLEENIIYATKNGFNDKARIGRERLLKLLDATELFNIITSQNVSLKLYNKQLLANILEIRRQDNVSNSM